MINTRAFLEAINTLNEEKKIEKSIILAAIKEGFQKAYEKYIDPEAILKVEIDEDNGEIEIFKELTIVEQVEDDEELEISLEQARKEYSEDVEIGDKVYEKIAFDKHFSKTAAIYVSQYVRQKISEYEKNIIFNIFKHKKGTMIGGVVVDITNRSYVVDIDGVQVSLWNKKIIPGEKIEEGMRLSMYVEDVDKENKYSQIVCSRICPEFLQKLFELEVPEVNEGIVEIKKIAREPGERAKVAVISHDPNIDPIGSCIGSKGSRINAISLEVNNEKIDVILYDESLVKFATNALAPFKVISVNPNEKTNELLIVVIDEHLASSIGKKGTMIRLISNLLNKKVTIYSYSKAISNNIEIFWNGNISEKEFNIKKY